MTMSDAGGVCLFAPGSVVVTRKMRHHSVDHPVALGLTLAPYFETSVPGFLGTVNGTTYTFDRKQMEQ